MTGHSEETMSALDLSSIPKAQMPAALFAAAALHALAREEARERKPQRLTEPGLATWQQFRGRLRSTDLVELLLEDAAVTQPTAFTVPNGVSGPSSLSAATLDGFIAVVGKLDLAADSADYVTAQAKRLGVGTRMARSALHRLSPQHKVLELPGSGGQLAHHLVSTHEGIFFHTHFRVACRSWQEALLAALIAVELGVSGPAPVLIDPELRIAREDGASYDFVIGVDPDKGGSFRKAELAELFPRATVLLV